MQDKGGIAMVGNTEIIARLLLASVLGALVGLEREVHGREAGIRTYLLVSLGSALIMVVSQCLILGYQGAPVKYLGIDPGRIAAQAVTGIGFLGAGAIIRYRNSTRGLTTAACMWVVSATGLAVGSGHYLFGMVVCGVTVFSLTALKTFEHRLKRDWYRNMLVIAEEADGQFEHIQQVLDGRDVKVTNLNIIKNREKKEFFVDYRLRFHTVEPLGWDIVRDVYAIDGVKRVELR